MRLPLNAADRFWLGLPDICLPLLTPTATCSTIQDVSQPIGYRWRGPVIDAGIVAFIAAHGGQAARGWWDQVRPHSLGWVTARLPGGGLVGFVNVAWDGGDHAFLLDTKVAGEHQRQGIATALVGHAARHAKAAGCEWLHVDFEEHLLRSTSMPVASSRPQPG